MKNRREKVMRIAAIAAGLVVAETQANEFSPEIEQILASEEAGIYGEPTYIEMSSPEASRAGAIAGDFDSHSLSSWL